MAHWLRVGRPPFGFAVCLRRPVKKPSQRSGDFHSLEELDCLIFWYLLPSFDLLDFKTWSNGCRTSPPKADLSTSHLSSLYRNLHVWLGSCKKRCHPGSKWQTMCSMHSSFHFAYFRGSDGTRNPRLSTCVGMPAYQTISTGTLPIMGAKHSRLIEFQESSIYL